MTIIGEAFVAVRPETAGFGKEAETQLGGIFQKLTSGPALLAESILGVGVALGDIGEHFETAFHTIETRTGATGAALQGLEQNFKDVFASAPGATFENVAAAVSEVAVRSGLTGSALDELARKEVELGKITKTDVGQNVQDTTALFNLFGIAADEQAAKLDVLFKASQVAGVSVTDIDNAMKSVQPTAQILGLTFEQTAAMTANLTALGLPAQKVMMGLGAEFAKAAKAGEDPLAVIGDLVNQIKQAPDATTAATLATKDFGIGARQAATLVDALRSGALDLGDTLAKITSGAGGIDATTESTLSLGDKFSLLKNKALVALEPIAMKVLDLANVMVDGIEPAVGFVVDVFERLGDVAAPIFSALGDVVGSFFYTLRTGFTEDEGTPIERVALGVRDAFVFMVDAGKDALTLLKDLWGDLVAGFEGKSPSGPVSFLTQMFYNLGGVYRSVLDGLKAAWAEVVTVFERPDVQNALATVRGVLSDVGDFVKDHLYVVFAGLGAAIALALGPVVTIPLLIAGIETLWQRSERFRDVVHQVGAALSTFGGWVMTVFHVLQDVLGPTILHIGGAMADFGRFFADRWEKISTSVRTVVEAIVVALKIVAVAIGVALLPAIFLWQHFHDQIFAVATFVWNQVTALISTTVRIIGDIFDFMISLLSGKWGDAWDDVKDILGAAVDFLLGSLGNLLSFVVDFFSGLPGNILGALGDLAGLLLTVGSALLGGLKTGIDNGAAAVWGFFTGLPGRLLNFVINADLWLLDTGVHIIGGILSGMLQADVALVDFFAGLPGRILELVKDAPGWLLSTGASVAQGFIDGLSSLGDTVGGAVEDAMKGAVNAVIGVFNKGIDFLDSFQVHVHKSMPGFIPNIDVDWDGLGIPHIPTLHTGGVVPGRPGEEILTRLLAGEVVLPPGIVDVQTRAPAAAASSSSADAALGSALATIAQLLREQTDVIRTKEPVRVVADDRHGPSPTDRLSPLVKLQTGGPR